MSNGSSLNLLRRRHYCQGCKGHDVERRGQWAVGKLIIDSIKAQRRHGNKEDLQKAHRDRQASAIKRGSTQASSLCTTGTMEPLSVLRACANRAWAAHTKNVVVLLCTFLFNN